MSPAQPRLIHYTSGQSRQEAITLWEEWHAATLDELSSATQARFAVLAKPLHQRPSAAVQSELAVQVDLALTAVETSQAALAALHRPSLETDPDLKEVTRTLLAIERAPRAPNSLVPQVSSEYRGSVNISTWWNLAEAGAPRLPASAADANWLIGSVLQVDTPGSVWYLTCWADSGLPEDGIRGPISPGPGIPSYGWFCLPLAFPETMRVIYEDFRVELGRENAIIALKESLDVSELPQQRLLPVSPPSAGKELPGQPSLQTG